MIMHIIDNITSNNHYAQLKESVSVSDEVILVSPFCFGNFNHFFDKIVSVNSIQTIVFVTTLRDDEAISKVPALNSFLAEAKKLKINSKILINNSLHGKVYIFKCNQVNQRAIITSANITHNGLSRNHEWGCFLSETSTIDDLERAIYSTIQYEMTAELLQEIDSKLIAYNKEQPERSRQKPPIHINDLIIPRVYNVELDIETRFFIKPIGSNEDRVYEGDYSQEEEQFFAKRPKAIRKGDYLISYGVGSRKIISIFKVISNCPLNTGEKDQRWPWYVEVENVTPKLGSKWVEQNLYIMDIAKEYVETYDFNITEIGGKTLGALKWGVDKIQVAHHFGSYLMELILQVEKKI